MINAPTTIIRRPIAVNVLTLALALRNDKGKHYQSVIDKVLSQYHSNEEGEVSKPLISGRLSVHDRRSHDDLTAAGEGSGGHANTHDLFIRLFQETEEKDKQKSKSVGRYVIIVYPYIICFKC